MGFTSARFTHVCKIHVFIVMTIVLVALCPPLVYGQIERPAFQETAQIIVDGIQTSTITASIVMQSTDTDEIRVPPDLEQRIREESITSIVVTNHDNCILGVVDKLCILVNIHELPNSDDIQDVSTDIGSRFIDDINDMFQTDAKFHSVFIHSDDQHNQALNTTGVVSGRGTISVVYTMPREDTSTLYQKMTDMLLSDAIRGKGGLYDVTNIMSNNPDAIATFSLIPLEANSLMQLKLSVISPINISETTRIDPLTLFGVDEMSRTRYLDTGFYQLNSLVHLVVLSPTNISVTDIQGYEIPTRLVDGQEIPTSITKPGWVFDSRSGSKIEAKYLFGDEGIIKKDDLVFSIYDPNNISDDLSDDTSNNIPNNMTNNELVESLEPSELVDSSTFSEQYVVVIVIVLVGVAAMLFYLKGYRRS